MKLTENEMYYILSESVRHIINEADSNNNNEREGFDEYYNDVTKRPWWNSGLNYTKKSSGVKRDKDGNIKDIQTGNKSRKGMNLTRAATFFGHPSASLGAATIAGKTNLMGLGLRGGGELLNMVFPGLLAENGAIIITGVIGLSILTMLADNIIKRSKFKNLKLPTFAKDVKYYARMAAMEKAKAQKICIEIKERVNIALSAYNIAARELKKDNIIWATQKLTINDIISDTTVFDNAWKNGQSDKARVNANTDFTDKNAGKDIANESRVSSPLMESQGGPEQEMEKFINLFKSLAYKKDEQTGKKIQNPDGEKLAQAELRKIGEIFTKAYSNWLQWVKYIGALCKKFPKVTDWDNAINGNVKPFRGETSNLPGALGKAHTLGKKVANRLSRGNTNWNKNANDNLKNIYFVEEPAWEYSLNNKKYYGVLLRNLATNAYVCIHRDGSLDDASRVKYVYSASDNTGKTVSGQLNNKDIQAILLNQNANKTITTL